jgi:hypothetical protein
LHVCLGMNRFLVAVRVLLFIATIAAAAADARLVTGNVADGVAVVNVQVDPADDSHHRNLETSPCNICGNQTSVRSLKLRYDLPSATSFLQGDNATCVNATYPETAVIKLVGNSISVRQGSQVTLYGKIPGKLEFDISGFGTCHIDASCSSPLVVGDKIGPFLIVAGNECPALAPTRRPTKRPTRRKPTRKPTMKPTRTPTRKPTRKPTTSRPTRAPTTRKPTRTN